MLSPEQAKRRLLEGVTVGDALALVEMALVRTVEHFPPPTSATVRPRSSMMTFAGGNPSLEAEVEVVVGLQIMVRVSGGKMDESLDVLQRVGRATVVALGGPPEETTRVEIRQVKR